jgi:hypothetical protein
MQEKTGIGWKERKESAKCATRRERETTQHIWNGCSEMRERKGKELGDTLNEDGSSFWKDNWKHFNLFPRGSFMFKSRFLRQRRNNSDKSSKVYSSASAHKSWLRRINELNLTDYPPHCPNLVSSRYSCALSGVEKI